MNSLQRIWIVFTKEARDNLHTLASFERRDDFLQPVRLEPHTGISGCNDRVRCGLDGCIATF